MLKFRTESKTEINGRRGAVVKLPSECEDFSHIIGHDVLIDGVEARVLGVERFAHSPPWRKGEMVGLYLAGGVP